MAKKLDFGKKSDDPPANECPGPGSAYGARLHEPHPPGQRVWGTCVRCKQPLGCSTCTTVNMLECLCKRCRFWGTKEALLHHGPFRTADLQRYPEDWQHAYSQSA